MAPRRQVIVLLYLVRFSVRVRPIIKTASAVLNPFQHMGSDAANERKIDPDSAGTKSLRLAQRTRAPQRPPTHVFLFPKRSDARSARRVTWPAGVGPMRASRGEGRLRADTANCTSFPSAPSRVQGSHS